MVSDSSAVVEAIIALLAADQPLLALMPDGVWHDVAPNGVTRFVAVSLVGHQDSYLFNAPDREAFSILAKAVELETSGANVSRAGFRIHELLQNARPAIPGYNVMNLKRAAYIETTEVDAVNETRWQHCGGQYELLVQPLATMKEQAHADSR